MSAPRALPAALLALPLLATSLACTGGLDAGATDDNAFTIDAAVSEVIAAVVTVTWSTDLGALDEAYVEFGPDDGYGRVATVQLSGGAPYEVALVGSKPSSDVHFRVAAVADGETTYSEDRTLSTGAAPNDLPELTVEQPGDVLDGFVVTSLFASPPGAVIVDRDGDYVWWYEAPNESFQVSRARLTADRQHVVFWSVNLSGGPGGGSQADQQLIRVSLDGTDVVTRDVAEGHHDFAVMPDGGIVTLEYDEQGDVEGDRVVEISPDGGEREVWSVWDDFTSGGGGGPGTQFSHFNAIDYVEDEDALYVSSLGLEAILKVDRASGELVWTMGGAESDFTLADGGTDLFDRNHQMHRLDDSLLVFVNGDEATNCSEAREYGYDGGGGDVELIWSYTPSPCVFTFSLGDVQRLDDGHTMVTFSNQGQIDEVDPDGELQWRLNADLGGAVGYATFLEDLHAVD